MDGMLSQEEINALLSGMDSDGDSNTEQSTTDSETNENEFLTESEKDTVGEISNISMGTAATTLSSLVNQKVNISIPVVTYETWDKLAEGYDRPCVFLQIQYREGLDGNNVLILKENDVKIIADLMMGGDGTNTDVELGELHLSAICEAMNQMMGSASTSLSSMLNMKIEIMQLFPVDFAKDLCNRFAADNGSDVQETPVSGGMGTEQKQEAVQGTPVPPQQSVPPQNQMPQPDAVPYGMPGGYPPMMGYPNMPYPGMPYGQPMPQMPMQEVNVQPAQFQAFSNNLAAVTQKENIDLIMDVPLEVTVELGRTSKSIQDILEFAPGTIIELDKIAGEPIDVLVNGKFVAKGEVVVIEESFGIRVTEIIK